MPPSTTDQFGQYKLWLAAQNTDIDVYQTDVIWAPQLANQLVDLTEATKDVVGAHFPSIIELQTVNGKLVALPIFTDAPALYYRKDLLDKYGAKVPTTWAELADTAKLVMDKEREAGNKDMWGFVFQGNAYEGLTCDALEWVKSNGGGQIIEPDGTISINNPQAAAAIEMAKGWVGTIAPPGVLAYQEEESRGVWQTGNAVFMRNWPYAYSLGNGDDSAIKGKFDVTTLPAGSGEGARSAATLGGWNLAVSKYSENPDAAIELVKWIASPEMQKIPRAEGVEPADHPGALRGCRHRQGAADHSALEGRLPQRGAAPFGPGQGQVQRGVEPVLDRRPQDPVRRGHGRRQPCRARGLPDQAQGRRLVASRRRRRARPARRSTVLV